MSKSTKASKPVTSHYATLLLAIMKRKTPIVIECESVKALRSGLKKARSRYNDSDAGQKKPVEQNISIVANTVKKEGEGLVVVPNQYEVVLKDANAAPFTIVK